MGTQFAVASLCSGTPLRLVQDVYDRKLCTSNNNIDDLPGPVNQKFGKTRQSRREQRFAANPRNLELANKMAAQLHEMTSS